MTASPLRRRAAGLGLAGLLAAGSFLAACGNDDPDEAAAETTETTGESGYDEVPMSEVLVGLPAMVAAGEAAETAADDGDFDAVLEHYEELHEVWEEIEGTVKATDLDRYEAIESAQSLIKDGGENEDAERVATGVAGQAEAVGSFIEDNG